MTIIVASGVSTEGVCLVAAAMAAGAAMAFALAAVWSGLLGLEQAGGRWGWALDLARAAGLLGVTALIAGAVS